jgi:hypothetical protein
MLILGKNSLIAKDLLKSFGKKFKNASKNTLVLAAFSTTNSCQNWPNKEWHKVLNTAEKLVGYPASLSSRKFLVSDEVENFTNLLRKLSNSKHPLINMAKRFILSSGDSSETKKSLQLNGILILLIAKAAGVPKRTNSKNSTTNEISEGIHVSQRSLAEITEMIYIGSLIHKGKFIAGFLVHF